MTKRVGNKGDVTRGHNEPWRAREEEAALAKRAEEAEKITGRTIMGGSGMAVEATVLSCTVDKGEVRCMVRLDGRVWRPEVMGETLGHVKEISIPAKVTRNEHSEED